MTTSSANSCVVNREVDAASNLVGEGGTDDPSTVKVGDMYVIARTVNEVNELVSSVKDPVGTPGGKVESTAFSYDGRGNRTGSVTTTVTGKKTHTVASSVFVYDGADQLTSTTGPDGTALWVRDGVGRALSVTEDGVVSHRLFDGFTVVADGDTQVVTGPDGQVVGETTTTSTTRGKNTSTSVTSVDVLTDVLGSAVATASGGVISADLQLFGDFGDLLTTKKPSASKTNTVTGFTGQVSTAGVVEFASRTFDPATRVWLQDDSFRGTTTRASSLNRYAYVEGAPESFVDVLGFYRARAAVRAQALAASQAAYDAAVAAYEAVVAEQARVHDRSVSNAHQQARLFQREVGQIQAQAASQQASAQWAREQAAQAVAAAEAAAAAAKKPWWDKATTWVSDHKAEIVGAVVGTVVGVVVFSACAAATVGAGSVGCAVLAGAAGGAAGGAVTGGMQYVEHTPADQRSVGGFLVSTGKSAVVGAVLGAAGGALGAGVGAVGGAVFGRIGSTAVGGAVRGALRPVTSAIAKPFTALATGVDDALRPLLAEGGSLGGLGTGFRTVAGGIDNAAATATNSVRTAITNTRSAINAVNWADDTGSIQIGRAATAANTKVNGVEIKALLGSDGDLVVLGRLDDTLVAQAWDGHVVLNTPAWNMDVNDAFLSGVVAQGRSVYLASPIEGNLVQAAGPRAGEPTVYARELEQLLAAGYRHVGDYMIPPGG